MARKSFKAGAVTAPVPPAMVTVGVGDEANVLTVAWTGILATVPPKTYISVRPSRHSHALLKRYGEFVINLAPAELAHTVDYVGMYTGKKVDKFKRCALTKEASLYVGTPTIKECPIAIECRVCEVIPMGSHDVFIADILGFTCDEKIIEDDGRISFERAGLIAYMHGEYFALGEKLGKFGFGTKRENAQAINATKSKIGYTGRKAKPSGARSNDVQGNGSGAGNADAVSKKSGKDRSVGKSGYVTEDDTASAAQGRAIPAKKGKDLSADSESIDNPVPFYKGLPKGVLKRSGKKKRQAKGGGR